MWASVAKSLTFARLSALITRVLIGQKFYPQSAFESANSITPANYYVKYGYRERYASLADLFACGHPELWLGEGTTETITATLAVPSNTIVRGRDSVIQLGADLIDALTIDGKSNITLEDFTLDGQRATYTTNSNDGISSPANGTGSTDIRMRRLIIKSFAGAGIVFLAQTTSHSARITVEDCLLDDLGAHGIICQDYVDDTRIVGNHVQNFGLGTADRPGITTGRSAVRHRVLGNTVICSASALGTSVHGISIDTANDFVCNDNVIQGCIGYGIEISGSREGTVVGNEVTDGTRACIAVSSQAAQEAGDLTIAGNVLTNGAAQGIYFFKGNGTAVDHVTVTGNVINTMGSLGISLTDTVTEVAINGNLIHDCVQSGIWADASTCDKIHIVGNVLLDNNSSASGSHGGITLASSGNTDFTVSPNRVTGSGNLDYDITIAIRDAGAAYRPSAQSFAALDATPDVSLGPDGAIFKTADTTTYTDFDGARGDGHWFRLLALNAATVSNNANIKTSTGANKTLTTNRMYLFTSQGGVWYETGPA